MEEPRKDIRKRQFRGGATARGGGTDGSFPRHARRPARLLLLPFDAREISRASAGRERGAAGAACLFLGNARIRVPKLRCINTPGRKWRPIIDRRGREASPPAAARERGKPAPLTKRPRNFPLSRFLSCPRLAALLFQRHYQRRAEEEEEEEEEAERDEAFPEKGATAEFFRGGLPSMPLPAAAHAISAARREKRKRRAPSPRFRGRAKLAREGRR